MNMEKEFDVKIWRQFYDRIHEIGNKLTNRENDLCTNLKERKKMDLRIDKLTRVCSRYLDHCKVIPNKPKWAYDVKDPKTKASSDKFVFNHLMPTNLYMNINL